ncbi:hypothetical protein [Hathewaya limosa]|uniref:Lipoprotein n=1 Tax=Hathewaya limosa TaxID=1536 RepID=A0ABU0JUP9_HATLI|nr:hypothetical protein [Hathewaya limosa]MDQ0480828.1 hypothetical protein [Hathewaya limosa]
MFKKKSLMILATTILSIVLLVGCSKKEKCPKKEEPMAKKPVIYLYPSSKQEVSLKLNYKGKLTCTYPEYKNRWNVIANPNGTLLNKDDNKQYSYLFWEGKNNNVNWDLSKGFVVKGEDTKEFLEKTLSYMGLTPKEYNEFIVYWLPIMEQNKYNLINFAGKQYTDSAQLEIQPKPDSMLRVFMVFKPLDKPIKVEKQKLNSFKRKGFTLVEWGGTELNK